MKLSPSPLFSKVPRLDTRSTLVFFRENNEIFQKRFTENNFSKKNQLYCRCFTINIITFSKR